MILRDSQQEFVDKSIVALEKYGRTVGVAPTGSGKTIMFSAVIGELMAKTPNIKVLVLAHREELINQNQEKFLIVNEGVSTSIVKADIKDWDGQVVFSMVQTLSRKDNLLAMPTIDLLVIDEAHHAPAASYRNIINRARELNPNLKLYGVTATPNRGDKKGLGEIFGNCAYQIELIELMTDGYLVEPKTYVIDVDTHEQLKKLSKNNMGEYNDGEVSAILNTETVCSEVIRNWKELAPDRKTVIFCSTRDQAKNVANHFNEAGILAGVITGDISSVQRTSILQALTDGRLQVIVNVGVLTEGWDYPPVSCVILLRMSSYKSTMIQMIGRGLRIVDSREYPGIVKTDCIVLDFGISTLLHKSLEQQPQLSPQKKAQLEKEAPYKTCPECNCIIPAGSMECAFCGCVIEQKEKEIIDNFKLKELKMFEAINKSQFEWIKTRENLLFASGFKYWCCVLEQENSFYTIGGRMDTVAENKVVYGGEKAIAIAKGNDFLRKNATNKIEKKDARWRHEDPTAKQKKYIKSFKYKYDVNALTKGQASNILSFEWQVKDQLKQVGCLV